MPSLPPQASAAHPSRSPPPPPPPLTAQGPLQPLCKSLLAALTDTGAQLAEAGHKTPGELLLAIGEELAKAG